MKVLWGILGSWCAIAFMLTVVNPPPEASSLARMLIIVGPIALLVLLTTLSSSFQQVMRQIPMKTLVILHIIRLPIGVLFLVLANLNLLPDDFAYAAGFGDIIVGGLALAIIVIYRRRVIHRALLVAWNIIGLLDFINAQRIVMTLTDGGRSSEFVAMQGPPLALVPYFAVPLLFFMHLYMLGKLARNDR